MITRYRLSGKQLGLQFEVLDKISLDYNILWFSKAATYLDATFFFQNYGIIKTVVVF
jgi:hypothetical protein